MKRRRTTQTDDSEVDLTPMLDVVFILLIFFIVTATFVRERGIDVLRPDNAPETPVEQVVPIVIVVTEQNEIQMGDTRTGEIRTIDVRAVRANVERARVDNPKSPVLIQAAEESDMGVVVRIMDQARQANVPNVSIATT